jgi:putative transposase
MRSLERWIAHETIAYNHDRHTQLGMSPAHAWERAWTRKGSLRIPTYPRDERDFLISFLPGTSRVVTREGIEWQRLHYRCRELEPYIKSGVKKIFRYDYRDVTKIYFEPPQGPHIEVPWIHDNLPTMSVWEWKEVRRNVAVPTRLVDRQMVHRARQANRRAIEQLATTNQRARRRIARQREWEREQRASTIPHASALPAPRAESIPLANLPMLTGEILE